MNSRTKIWLIVAVCLVVAGCAVFSVIMSIFNWDFTKLSTVKYETNEYEMTEKFKNISIITDTADVVFVPSESDIVTVKCYEGKNTKHSVTVKDDTLSVEIKDTRAWYEYIGISFDSPKITVTLPADTYSTLSVKLNTGDTVIPSYFSFDCIDVSGSTGDVECYASATQNIKIKTSTGNIKIDDFSTNSVDLTVSTGHVTLSNAVCKGDVKVKVTTGKAELTNVHCKNLNSTGNTGNLTLNGVSATDNLSITRSTGNVKLDGCDAAEIFVKTDTGNVKGTLLSDKVFITKTDTGKVDVTKTLNGGKCEIVTDTGNIILSVK